MYTSHGGGRGEWGIHLCRHLEMHVPSVSGWNRLHSALCIDHMQWFSLGLRARCKYVLHFFRQIASESDDLISEGRLFQRYGAATGKSRYVIWELLVKQALKCQMLKFYVFADSDSNSLGWMGWSIENVLCANVLILKAILYLIFSQYIK